MKYLSLIFILFLFACNSSNAQSANFPKHSTVNIHILIDEQFSFPEENQIIAGLVDWENATNDFIHFTITPSANYFDKQSNDTNAVFIERAFDNDRLFSETNKSLTDKKQKAIGLFYMRNNQASIISISPDLLNEYDEEIGVNIEAITEHEMGHRLLGNTHSASRKSIMFHDLSKGSKGISKLDLEIFCYLNNCDADNL